MNHGPTFLNVTGGKRPVRGQGITLQNLIEPYLFELMCLCGSIFNHSSHNRNTIDCSIHSSGLLSVDEELVIE